MNKSEFTRAYADRLGVTIKEAEVLVATFIETVKWWIDNGMKELPETIVEYFYLAV